MSRHKKKNNGNSNTIINNAEIDYDKLAEAIVRANIILKEQEKADENNTIDAKVKEWNKIIGVKDYPDSEKFFKRKIHEIRNDISLLLHIVFFKEKNAKYDVATFGLLQMATICVFSLCKLILYVLTLLFLVATFFTLSNKEWIFYFNPVYLLYAFLTFFFSRIFRVASFEIKNITDRNYLIGILSATTCFFAMIIAILTLVKG